ncbi:MAG: DUF2156 domain-containing protein [Clostridiales bacterium]|nr:DUF2156 domain-containing protein [Clostridiales bacterium]
MLHDSDFKEIELGDKEVFDKYIGKRIHDNSEFNFTNFFIWRYHYKLNFSIYKNHLCIIGQYRNTFPIIFPPLGDQESGFDDALMAIVAYFKYKGYPVNIKSITDPIKEIKEESLPGKFRFKHDRDMYDYVYLSEDLINLRGRKYQKKRNHINRFLSRYTYDYEPITKDNLEECLIAEIEWAAGRPKDNGIEEEKVAIVEALRNMETLGIKGGALRINDRIQAFSLGEELNPNMAVIHIEKANVEYEGSYAMINQQFAENSWSHLKYINREEDMGIHGLRKAKKSYHPIKMITKYTGNLI